MLRQRGFRGGVTSRNFVQPDVLDEKVGLRLAVISDSDADSRPVVTGTLAALVLVGADHVCARQRRKTAEVGLAVTRLVYAAEEALGRVEQRPHRMNRDNTLGR